MLWLKALKREPEAFNDFVLYMQTEREKAVMQIISAKNWEAALKSQGRLSEVDLMIANIENLKEQEHSYAGRTNGQQ